MRWYVFHICRPADSCNIFINKVSHYLDRQGSFLVQSHTFSKAKGPVKTWCYCLLVSLDKKKKNLKIIWTLRSFLSKKNLQNGHMPVNWELQFLGGVQHSCWTDAFHYATMSSNITMWSIMQPGTKVAPCNIVSLGIPYEFVVTFKRLRTQFSHSTRTLCDSKECNATANPSESDAQHSHQAVTTPNCFG